MPLSLDAVLDAALDDRALHRLLSDYSQTIGAKGFAAGLASGPAVEHMFIYENDWSEALVARYHREFAARDLWTIASLSDPRFDQFVRMSELVSPAAYAASPLWTDLLEPAGDDTFYALGLKTQIPGGLGGITFYRGREAGDFDDATLAVARSDEAHLARVIGIKAVIAQGAAAARTWRAVCESFAGELYVLDATGHLLDCNAPGRAQLDRGDVLQTCNSRLAARRREGRQEFDRQVRHVLAESGVGSIALDDELGRSVCYRLIRINGSGAAARILVLGELGQGLDQSVRNHLCRTYRFTPAEADVIFAMVEGGSLQDVSARRGSSYQTVRSQYRSALGKMGCRRLTEAISITRRTPPFISDG